MSEDDTKDLTDRQLLEGIFAKMISIEERMTIADQQREKQSGEIFFLGSKLGEVQNDFTGRLGRLEATAIQTLSAVEDIQIKLQRIEEKFDLFTEEHIELRKAQRSMNKRHMTLEEKPS